MPKAPEAPKSPAATAVKPAVPSDAAKAFAEIEPILTALSPEQLIPINVDIPRAVAIAIGAVPHLAKLRLDAAKLPDFDVSHLDRIGTYALAAWYAHLLALPETTESALTALLDEAKPLREDLFVAAGALAHKKIFDRAAVLGPQILVALGQRDQPGRRGPRGFEVHRGLRPRCDEVRRGEVDAVRSAASR